MAAPNVRKGRRVICHATGIYGNSLDYFKAPDGFYYQTKELYEQKKQESDYYRQVVTRMASYMGYEPGDVFPTVITRGLMQFKHYGYAAVLATMEECQSKIEYALASRSFGSDYQKASYLMAILTNNINDVARRLKSQQEFESRQAAPQQAPPPQDFTSAAQPKDITDFLEGGD